MLDRRFGRAEMTDANQANCKPVFYMKYTVWLVGLLKPARIQSQRNGAH